MTEPYTPTPMLTDAQLAEYEAFFRRPPVVDDPPHAGGHTLLPRRVCACGLRLPFQTDPLIQPAWYAAGIADVAIAAIGRIHVLLFRSTPAVRPAHDVYEGETLAMMGRCRDLPAPPPVHPFLRTELPEWGPGAV